VNKMKKKLKERLKEMFSFWLSAINRWLFNLLYGFIGIILFLFSAMGISILSELNSMFEVYVVGFIICLSILIAYVLFCYMLKEKYQVMAIGITVFGGLLCLEASRGIKVPFITYIPAIAMIIDIVIHSIKRIKGGKNGR